MLEEVVEGLGRSLRVPERLQPEVDSAAYAAHEEAPRPASNISGEGYGRVC
jgi:hypothetical protein